MLLLNYIKLAWRNLAKRKLYSFISIHLQPWMFVLSALIAAFTALLAIGAQTLKAAVRNPVNALKIE